MVVDDVERVGRRKVKARVIRPEPSWRAHRRTRPPWVTVPSKASRVQPSVRSGGGGRAVRSVRGVRGSEGVLRRLRVGGGPVRSLLGGAAALSASGSESDLFPIGARACVGTAAPGPVSCAPPAGCNVTHRPQTFSSPIDVRLPSCAVHSPRSWLAAGNALVGASAGSLTSSLIASRMTRVVSSSRWA